VMSVLFLGRFLFVCVGKTRQVAHLGLRNLPAFWRVAELVDRGSWIVDRDPCIQ
jgi:hypothetical protein